MMGEIFKMKTIIHDATTLSQILDKNELDLRSPMLMILMKSIICDIYLVHNS